jgi:quercetin dioxygenase-like cupin family protein
MNTIDKIKDTQATIDMLLKLGEFASDYGIEGKWVLEPLHDDNQCSVGLVDIGEKKLGPCKPHVHKESKEYLICVSGSFVLNVNGRNVREIKEGECGVVDAGDVHYSTPLEDNTRMVYVCVPADRGMSILEKQLLEKQLRRTAND